MNVAGLVDHQRTVVGLDRAPARGALPRFRGHEFPHQLGHFRRGSLIVAGQVRNGIVYLAQRLAIFGRQGDDHLSALDNHGQPPLANGRLQGVAHAPSRSGAAKRGRAARRRAAAWRRRQA